MRIGLHSYSRREAFKHLGYDVFTFLDEAAAWGFESVELTTGGAGSPPTDIGSDDPRHLERVCTHARQRGIQVHCLSTYNDFAFVKNEAWRQDNIAYIRHWIELASQCGVPNLRLLSGYWSGDRAHADLEQLVMAAIRDCCNLAERAGVNLAFENHSSIFLYAGDILRLIGAVNSPRLTTCPDPTNGFSSAGDNAAELERLYANLEQLAPKATNAHIKIFGAANGELAGYDIGRIVRIFTAAGYDGPLHFELAEATADPGLLLQARDILRAALERQSLAEEIR